MNRGHLWISVQKSILQKSILSVWIFVWIEEREEKIVLWRGRKLHKAKSWVVLKILFLVWINFVGMLIYKRLGLKNGAI